ncbi:SDR family oxidoreductase [Nocardiopsis sp. RSe5-2]|uniref:SDR family oxidoreductase n=1 Tax=Nocardiopsis endophytica TaxID=3018445 RepID=A0ABT4U1T0_9ACTN|nr:SDR family oxidoreductase [Nocardiopsis endophytica]MDA2810898.1 SDR family oxidoreductase [Nocardiopsis endophytica]
MATAITGATGFLGLHLLEHIAADGGGRGSGEVLLLTRRSREDALGLVSRHLEARGFDTPAIGRALGRMEAVHADVTLPRLGLTDDDHAELADRIDEMWHCAGDTTLSDDADHVHGINVEGTRNVLALLDRSARTPALRHASTVAVAGARGEGVIGDDDLDDSYGFHTPYERSKYDAEVLVREWAARTGGSAVVFRPSILVTDRPAYPGRPVNMLEQLQHTIGTVHATLAGSLRGREVPVAVATTVHMVPVEDAAHAMAAAAPRLTGTGVRSCNVVTRRGTSLFEAAGVLAEPFGIRVVPGDSSIPADVAGAVADKFRGLVGHENHTRRFSDAALHALGLRLPSSRRVDTAYLRRALLNGVKGAPA